MANAYEYLRESLPIDHARQSRATDVVLQKVSAGFAPTNVLDLGCGIGSSVSFFSKHIPGASWTGVDIEHSPEVSQRTKVGEEFVTYDGMNLPFNDGRFDLIFSNQVFEHVRFPERLLTEVRRTLAQGGLFIGQTSHLEPFHSFSYWNFTAWGWKQICQSAGLALLEIRPGIDGITLTNRSYLGRPDSYSKWFSEESPLNTEIDILAKEKKLSIPVLNFRKLMYCGQFSFCCVRDDSVKASDPIRGYSHIQEL